jgi:cytoskeletal protein CcmA (bactofilin family)
MTAVNQIVTQEHLSRITAYVAERTTFRGDMIADEGDPGFGLKVDGKIEGTIKVPTGGIVHIGPTGIVRGRAGQDGASEPAIDADLIYIEGTVHGKVVARKGVEISPSATVTGEIIYHEGISVHNLAKVRATINFAEEGGRESAISATSL